MVSFERTPALILKFVVSPSGVSPLAEVFSYIICMALTIFGWNKLSTDCVTARQREYV